MANARKEDLAEAGDARERGTLVHQALHTAPVTKRLGHPTADLLLASAVPGQRRAQRENCRLGMCC